MPDVSSIAPADVRLWVALEVHKLSIAAATLPPAGGRPEPVRIETTEKAIRRCIDRLGGPDGLAVRSEAGPGGFALWRLLSAIGVAGDIVAPSLVPIRAGDRVKTDRRDSSKLVAPHRGRLLGYVQPPTPETEGLRDLSRCREDLRCARTAARHRAANQPLRHGRVLRDAVKRRTLKHRAWVARQRLDDPLAQLALAQTLIDLDGIDRRLAALDTQLEQIADHPRWAWPIDRPRAFRGISTPTALGLIAEIGDLARISHPRELASRLGITPARTAPAPNSTANTPPRPATTTPTDWSSPVPPDRVELSGEPT